MDLLQLQISDLDIGTFYQKCEDVRRPYQVEPPQLTDLYVVGCEDYELPHQIELEVGQLPQDEVQEALHGVHGE